MTETLIERCVLPAELTRRQKRRKEVKRHRNRLERKAQRLKANDRDDDLFFFRSSPKYSRFAPPPDYLLDLLGISCDSFKKSIDIFEDGGECSSQTEQQASHSLSLVSNVPPSSSLQSYSHFDSKGTPLSIASYFPSTAITRYGEVPIDFARKFSPSSTSSLFGEAGSPEGKEAFTLLSCSPESHLIQPSLLCSHNDVALRSLSSKPSDQENGKLVGVLRLPRNVPLLALPLPPALPYTKTSHPSSYLPPTPDSLVPLRAFTSATASPAHHILPVSHPFPLAWRYNPPGSRPAPVYVAPPPNYLSIEYRYRIFQFAPGFKRDQGSALCDLLQTVLTHMEKTRSEHKEVFNHKSIDGLVPSSAALGGADEEGGGQPADSLLSESSREGVSPQGGEFEGSAPTAQPLSMAPAGERVHLIASSPAVLYRLFNLSRQQDTHPHCSFECPGGLSESLLRIHVLSRNVLLLVEYKPSESMTLMPAPLTSASSSSHALASLPPYTPMQDVTSNTASKQPRDELIPLFPNRVPKQLLSSSSSLSSTPESLQEKALLAKVMYYFLYEAQQKEKSSDAVKLPRSACDDIYEKRVEQRSAEEPLTLPIRGIPFHSDLQRNMSALLLRLEPSLRRRESSTPESDDNYYSRMKNSAYSRSVFFDVSPRWDASRTSSVPPSIRLYLGIDAPVVLDQSTGKEALVKLVSAGLLDGNACQGTDSTGKSPLHPSGESSHIPSFSFSLNQDQLFCWWAEGFVARVPLLLFYTHRLGALESCFPVTMEELQSAIPSHVTNFAVEFAVSTLRFIEEHCTIVGGEYELLYDHHQRSVQILLLRDPQESATEPSCSRNSTGPPLHQLSPSTSKESGCVLLPPPAPLRLASGLPLTERASHYCHVEMPTTTSALSLSSCRKTQVAEVTGTHHPQTCEVAPSRKDNLIISVGTRQFVLQDLQVVRLSLYSAFLISIRRSMNGLAKFYCSLEELPAGTSDLIKVGKERTVRRDSSPVRSRSSEMRSSVSVWMPPNRWVSSSRSSLTQMLKSILHGLLYLEENYFAPLDLKEAPRLPHSSDKVVSSILNTRQAPSSETDQKQSEGCGDRRNGLPSAFICPETLGACFYAGMCHLYGDVALLLLWSLLSPCKNPARRSLLKQLSGLLKELKEANRGKGTTVEWLVKMTGMNNEKNADGFPPKESDEFTFLSIYWAAQRLYKAAQEGFSALSLEETDQVSVAAENGEVPLSKAMPYSNREELMCSLRALSYGQAQAHYCMALHYQSQKKWDKALNYFTLSLKCVYSVESTALTSADDRPLVPSYTPSTTLPAALTSYGILLIPMPEMCRTLNEVIGEMEQIVKGPSLNSVSSLITAKKWFNRCQSIFSTNCWISQ